MPLIAKRIKDAPVLTGVVDVDNINANNESLKVSLIAEAKNGAAIDISVIFPELIGFRCLDELDVLEFWPTCSLANGWLYEINDGGWRSLESTRDGFSSKSVSFHREFLVVTRDTCISVIAKSEPTLTHHSSGTPNGAP